MKTTAEMRKQARAARREFWQRENARYQRPLRIARAVLATLAFAGVMFAAAYEVGRLLP